MPFEDKFLTTSYTIEFSRSVAYVSSRSAEPAVCNLGVYFWTNFVNKVAINTHARYYSIMTETIRVSCARFRKLRREKTENNSGNFFSVKMNNRYRHIYIRTYARTFFFFFLECSFVRCREIRGKPQKQESPTALLTRASCTKKGRIMRAREKKRFFGRGRVR